MHPVKFAGCYTYDAQAKQWYQKNKQGHKAPIGTSRLSHQWEVDMGGKLTPDRHPDAYALKSESLGFATQTPLVLTGYDAVKGLTQDTVGWLQPGKQFNKFDREILSTFPKLTLTQLYSRCGDPFKDEDTASVTQVAPKNSPSANDGHFIQRFNQIA